MKTLFALCLLFPTFASAEKTNVDPFHSSVTFTASHFLVSRIPGRFEEFSGAIDLDQKDFTRSKVEFTVKVASISTSVDKRDEHLRTADFFDAAKFPEATFVSTGIKVEGGHYLMKGKLTIRGVTREETFRVKTLGRALDPMLKAERLFFRATGRINRKDYGVSYGDNALVGDVVMLDINLESLPAKED